MADFYNFETDGKYLYRLTPILTLEDAGDEFMTKDELDEMFGAHKWHSSFGGWCIRRNEVKAVLEQMIADAAQKGKKSWIVADAELIAALKDNGHLVCEFVPGLRRIGNRLFFNPPTEKVERTKPNKRDHDQLIAVASQVINATIKCHFEVKYVAQDREGGLRLIQKLVTWEQVAKQLEGHSEVAINRLKQIWDDPTLITTLLPITTSQPIEYVATIKFDDYVEGSMINHDALERGMVVAIQEWLDKLQRTGDGCPNPLVMPMVVTQVKFETDFPDSDDLPDDLREFSTAAWIAFLRKMDDLTLTEIANVAYVADRVRVHFDNHNIKIDNEEVYEIARGITSLARSLL